MGVDVLYVRWSWLFGLFVCFFRILVDVFWGVGLMFIYLDFEIYLFGRKNIVYECGGIGMRSWGLGERE